MVVPKLVQNISKNIYCLHLRFILVSFFYNNTIEHCLLGLAMQPQIKWSDQQLGCFGWCFFRAPFWLRCLQDLKQNLLIYRCFRTLRWRRIHQPESSLLCLWLNKRIRNWLFVHVELDVVVFLVVVVVVVVSNEDFTDKLLQVFVCKAGTGRNWLLSGFVTPFQV